MDGLSLKCTIENTSIHWNMSFWVQPKPYYVWSLVPIIAVLNSVLQIGKESWPNVMGTSMCNVFKGVDDNYLAGW